MIKLSEEEIKNLMPITGEIVSTETLNRFAEKIQEKIYDKMMSSRQRIINIDITNEYIAKDRVRELIYMLNEAIK